MAAGNLKLGLIVEGQGEVQAAPVLIRKIAAAHDCYAEISITSHRIPKSELVREGGLESGCDILVRQIGRSQPILILLDADDDCPKDLARTLTSRCRSDLTISVVIANREYEAWFLSAARSLSGKRGLPDALAPPEDPESVRGAKQWLTSHMPPNQSYSPTRHQAAFSDQLDLADARSSRSFRKFEKELGRLLGWS